MDVPPLLGDKQGGYRIHIVGNSGTGKSTLGVFLAKTLNIPYISLDALFWCPGWSATPDTEFRQKVQTLIDNSPRGWVVDGQYARFLGSVVDDNATDIIWLDPPFLLYFPRLLWRTVARLLRITPPCSPGCDESLREVLSTEGIVWWCISQHSIVRKKQGELVRRLGVDVGGHMRRIGGWGGELERFKWQVEEMVRVQ